MNVLAGDIGGTKTLLQLAEVDGSGCRVLYETRFESGAWSSFLPMLEEFLRTAPLSSPIETICFAVAGPVDGARATVTNLPWENLNATSLTDRLGVPRVLLINDFQAVGYGLMGLAAADVAVLQEGRERLRAPRALLGAGTGLGQGILVWQSDRYEPLATEGGHVDFAPVDEEQLELLRFLMTRHDHVSYERLLSGSGLVTLYQFLRGPQAPETALEAALADPQCDPAAVISNAALAANDPVAVRTLRLFARIYGQQAGNLALTCLAGGGVYLAGGIAPRILPFLQDGAFLHSFQAKGRMGRLLTEMPVRVVLNPQVGLLGAAMAAARV
jgi:glucokinase